MEEEATMDGMTRTGNVIYTPERIRALLARRSEPRTVARAS